MHYSASNFYSNVYSNASDAVSFPTTTNCSITNIRITGSGSLQHLIQAVSSSSMPALNNTADCELTDIEVTGTIRLIAGGIYTSGKLVCSTSERYQLKAECNMYPV